METFVTHRSSFREILFETYMDITKDFETVVWMNPKTLHSDSMQRRPGPGSLLGRKAMWLLEAISGTQGNSHSTGTEHSAP